MHRVHMRFERIFERWAVTFINMDNREALPDYTFDHEWKVEQLAERAGALTDLATKQRLESGLRHGLGAIVLQLTSQQYDKLRRI